jgi:heat shock protein HtpX
MDTLRTTFLLAFLSVTFVSAGTALHGVEGALIAFVSVSVLHGIGYWWSDKIILRIRGAKELGPAQAPRLYSLVQELAIRTQVPMPILYLLPKNNATPFAIGRNEKHAALAVTKQNMQSGDEANLRSVLAAELARLKKRDRLVGTLAATAAGAISLAAVLGK